MAGPVMADEPGSAKYGCLLSSFKNTTGGNLIFCAVLGPRESPARRCQKWANDWKLLRDYRIPYSDSEGVSASVHGFPNYRKIEFCIKRAGFVPEARIRSGFGIPKF
jgi:hypothetical protein